MKIIEKYDIEDFMERCMDVTKMMILKEKLQVDGSLDMMTLQQVIHHPECIVEF